MYLLISLITSFLEGFVRQLRNSYSHFFTGRIWLIVNLPPG